MTTITITRLERHLNHQFNIIQVLDGKDVRNIVQHYTWTNNSNRLALISEDTFTDPGRSEKHFRALIDIFGGSWA